MAIGEISKGDILPLDQVSVLFTLLERLQQNQKLYVYAYESLIGMRILDILIVF